MILFRNCLVMQYVCSEFDVTSQDILFEDDRISPIEPVGIIYGAAGTEIIEATGRHRIVFIGEVLREIEFPVIDPVDIIRVRPGITPDEARSLVA